MELTLIELADEMLKFLATDFKAKGNITHGDFFTSINKKFNIDKETYFTEIVEEFLEEKYIGREVRELEYIDDFGHKTTTYLYISLKGRLFYLSGGYKGRIADELRAKATSEMLQKNQTDLQTNQMSLMAAQTRLQASQTDIQDSVRTLTRFLVVVAIASCVLQAIAIYWDRYKFYHPFCP